MAQQEFRRHLDFTIINKEESKPKEKAPQLPFGKRVEQYIKGLTEFDAFFVAKANEQLSKHATPAFKNPKNEPKIVITMPVAAHQEGAYIEQALEQYAKQEQAPPHEIILFCNWPLGTDKQAVSDTLQKIDRFMSTNPDVPIGYFMAELTPDTPIGAIRKHIADTALSRLQGSTSDEDVLMVNHDADITKLNKRHFANLHAAFTQPGKEVTTVTPRVMHQRGLRNEQGELLFPNIDKVTAWDEFCEAMGYGYYDLGNGLSARKVMDHGGYDRSKRESETLDLIRRMHDGKSWNSPNKERVPGATLICSSRRQIYRLYADRDSLNFWNGDFSSSDHYRTEDFNQLADITATERDRLILTKGLIWRNINGMFNLHTRQGLPKEEAFRKAKRTVTVGLNLLDASQLLKIEFLRESTHFEKEYVNEK